MFRDHVKEHYRVRGYTLHEDTKVRGRSGTVYRCDMVAEGPLGSLVVSFGDAGGFEGPELSSVKRTATDIGAAPVVAAPRLPEPALRAARELGVIVLDEETVGASRGGESSDGGGSDHPWPDPDRPRQSRTVPTASTEAPMEPPASDASDPRAGPGAGAQGLWKHPRPGAQEAVPERQTARGRETVHGPQTGRDSAPVQEPSPQDPNPRREATGRRFGWLPGREEPSAPPDRPAPAPQRSQAAPPRPRMDLPRVGDTPPRKRVLEVEAPGEATFPWQWVWGPVLYGVVTGLVLFLFVALFL